MPDHMKTYIYWTEPKRHVYVVERSAERARSLGRSLIGSRGLVRAVPRLRPHPGTPAGAIAVDVLELFRRRLVEARSLASRRVSSSIARWCRSRSNLLLDSALEVSFDFGFTLDAMVSALPLAIASRRELQPRELAWARSVQWLRTQKRAELASIAEPHAWKAWAHGTVPTLSSAHQFAAMAGQSLHALAVGAAAPIRRTRVPNREPGHRNYATIENWICTGVLKVDAQNGRVYMNGREITSTTAANDGQCVYLQHANRRVTMMLGRLVYFAGHGSLPTGMKVSHRDGDPSHNVLRNLVAVPNTERR